ncbi:MAG: hypothetical protein LAN84_12555 [Acidobacteriia bacterium]|nr:hypothetical protein [Terriglobia bacterium]
MTVPARSAELKPKTIAAFQHYVELSEARMATELADPEAFLWVDRLPAERRQALRAQLLQGRVITERLETREAEKRIAVPGGLMHHWVALIFFPGVSLPQVLELQQDYAHHQEMYKPDVQRSRLVSREGNDFTVYFRFYRKAIVTAVYNTEFAVRFFPLDAGRAWSRSYSTRIAEVEDPGKPSEHEKPVGRDRGYLWRLDTYTRYQEKDGGVYMQIEFIALSRSVPAIFAWLVNPYIKSVPREYLTHLLEATRKALKKKEDASSGSGAALRRKAVRLTEVSWPRCAASRRFPGWARPSR